MAGGGATGNNSTNYDAILKEYYSEDEIENALFEDHKLLGMIPKKEDAEGRHYVYPVVIGAGQGRSADFATAQKMASLSGDGVVDFMVPLVENFAVANVSSKLMSQAKRKGPGAFLEAVSEIANNQRSSLGNDLSIAIYRGSDGARGKIGSTTTIASSTVVLATAADILNFEVGQQLDLASALTTGSTRAYGSNSHGLYVTSINPDAGSFTVGIAPSLNATACNISDAADGIPTAAVGDFIYPTGDRNVRFSGIFDWLPQTVASNDSFMNVNRSGYKTRLAGTWVEGRGGQSIASVLEGGMARVAQFGGKTTHIFMNYLKFAQLSTELGAKTQMVDVDSTKAGIGYTGIKVMGTKGPAIVLGDLHCPADKIYLLDIDTWDLLSVGKAARIWDDDGNTWLRMASASGLEIRFYSYCALACKNPRSNAVIQVTGVS